jgi:hypothetical protein
MSEYFICWTFDVFCLIVLNNKQPKLFRFQTTDNMLHACRTLLCDTRNKNSSTVEKLED